MDTRESIGQEAGDLSQLLEELRRAGESPDRELLDRVKAHGQAAMGPLIEMAVEENEGVDPDSPEAWAYLHGLRLLGEMGAGEAIEPLLPLFDRTEDLALIQVLPEVFGGIGAPAVAPMRAILFDRTAGVQARLRAAESLSKIGQLHPEVRSQVVDALVARLDPAESLTPEDETIVAFAISGLVDLEAVEAAPAILRAFEEDRVDTMIIDLDFTLKKLGLPARPRPGRSPEESGMQLRLKCTACGYERMHDVGTVYYDLNTAERKDRGEETPYSPYVITRPITCPKCGAEDRYELTGMAYLALTVELLKSATARKAAGPDAEVDEGNLRFIHFELTDGRQMHPLAAREMYRQKVESEPSSVDLRVRYGNVLRFLGRREEAIGQYNTALELEDGNLEALLNLGQLAGEAGDQAEARRRYESILAQAPRSKLPSEERNAYAQAAEDALFALPGRGPLPTSRAPAARPLGTGEPGRRGVGVAPPQQPIRGTKVGRNEPCPCGSGKKYKRCHGR